MKIEQKHWVWIGIPMHFLGASDCHFRLATIIGKYVISSVGKWRPKGRTTTDFQIGADRTYETMVFDNWKECDIPGCECRMPVIEDVMEIDSRGYNTAKDAQQGHMEMCFKYANMEQP